MQKIQELIKSNKMTAVLLFLVIIVLILLIMTWKGVGPFVKKTSTAKEKWQAVFLTNGQVYFGKLKTPGLFGRYYSLKEIYYLQTKESIQPPEESKKQQIPELQLIKLGNELHGPKDIMYIDKNQVIFWEDMKDDSKVVQTITDFKSGKIQPQQTNQ